MSTSVNLTELIEPCQYKLENMLYGANTVKQMTMYDVKHVNDCKDLLELIIRAHFYNYKAHVFYREQQDSSKIDKYEKLVDDLITHVKHIAHDPIQGVVNIMDIKQATGRYADFIGVMVESDLNHIYYTTFDQTNNCYYIMAKCGNKNWQMGKINKWQADYFAIFNVIMKMGKNADMFGANAWVVDRFVKWQNGTNNQYDDMVMPCVSTMSDTENTLDSKSNTAVVVPDAPTKTEQPQNTSDSKTHTAKITSDAPTKLVPTSETYKMLFKKRQDCDNILFDSAAKIAKLIEAKGTYIVVEIGSNTMVFNTGRKYLTRQSSVNLSEYCTHDVEYITVQNIGGTFAYPGFIFEGVTYQIDGLQYYNMYHYIKFGGNDLSMIPPEAIKLADEVEKRIECLPEIAFSKCDNIECKSEFIKIEHGPNVITTFISDDLYGEYIGGFHTESRKNDYVKSETIIGNFEGRPHLFLKIGKQTYKIKEINKFSAANILYTHGYFTSA